MFQLKTLDDTSNELSQDAKGTGMGEGDGVKDVSDQIDDQAQPSTPVLVSDSPTNSPHKMILELSYEWVQQLAKEVAKEKVA